MIFGCVAYALVSKEKRYKFDYKSEKCIFIGYSENSKAYKLYNRITMKVLISRDVVFIENEAWDGTMDDTTGISFIIPFDDEEAPEVNNLGGAQENSSSGRNYHRALEKNSSDDEQQKNNSTSARQNNSSK